MTIEDALDAYKESLLLDFDETNDVVAEEAARAAIIKLWNDHAPCEKADRIPICISPEARKKLIALLFTKEYQGVGYTEFIERAVEFLPTPTEAAIIAAWGSTRSMTPTGDTITKKYELYGLRFGDPRV